MDVPVNVPIDDPNADTEWNDILRKHKIIPEKPPSPTGVIEEALVEARQLAHENRLEGKDLEELEELEDEEDEAFLEQYRAKRLNELASLRQKSIFNHVYPLQKPEYAKEVTEASNHSFVAVLLTSSHSNNDGSCLLIEIWRELARRFGDVKFCQMRADLCIENYPDRNTPTVLIYKDGDIKKQIITLKDLKGMNSSIEDLIDVFVQLGAIRHQDSRIGTSREDESYAPENIRKSLRGAQTREKDEDSDYD